MLGEQVRLQVPPKLHRVDSWITQIIRQRVQNCGSGDSLSPEGAALNTWKRQLMTSQSGRYGDDRELRKLAHISRRDTLQEQDAGVYIMECHSTKATSLH